MLYSLYRALGTVVHVVLQIGSPLLKLIVPNWDISSRLGRMPAAEQGDKSLLIWIHAASIGEVQAARALIRRLTDLHCGCRFYVTTMTRQGREVARSQLPSGVQCALAPLDTPQAVAGALQAVQPDIYICLETELWPVLLTRIRQKAIPLLLLNGRMSERSCRQYGRIAKTMAQLLGGFTAIAVISDQDRERYERLGAVAERMRICGNMKYGLQVPNVRRVRDTYRQILTLGGETVFICGSTHSEEEKLLLPVYTRLRAETSAGLLWIIAPRHLNRLDEVGTILDKAHLEYDLLSDCKKRGRKESIILVDSMGELADLYSLTDFIFCGGSLVDKGGHNIMEPIRLQRPVYFGPYMNDFQDAVELVVSAGAGFQVENADELADCLIANMRDPDQFQQACRAAAGLAELQQGAVQCQTDMVMQHLAA